MFEPGTQIAYLPPHVNGNINHTDVQYGFVTSHNRDFIFCRFWAGHTGVLRNTGNSEPVPHSYIVKYKSRPQAFVDNVLVKVYKEALYYD